MVPDNGTKILQLNIPSNIPHFSTSMVCFIANVEYMFNRFRDRRKTKMRLIASYN